MPGTKEPHPHPADAAQDGEHRQDRLATALITACRILDPRLGVLMKWDPECRGHALPQILRACQAQPSAPTPDVPPLRARPARGDAVWVREVWPPLHSRLRAVLHRKQRRRIRDLLGIRGQAQPAVRHEARGIDREVPVVGLAADHCHWMLRPGLAPPVAVEPNVAEAVGSFGTGGRSGDLSPEKPFVVLPILADDEVRLALMLACVTCSLALLQRNTTLRAGCVLGTGPHPLRGG